MGNAISFDYKTISVKREIESIVCDAYENLGWELTNTSSVEGNPFKVNLSFKRDRKIERKIELLKLQQKIDICLEEVKAFQAKRKNAGVAESVATGVVGALTFGGGMSMVMTLKGLGFMLGGIGLGVVGLGICGLAWVIYKKIRKKKNEEYTPIIESELDNLSDLCEEANEIVNNKGE